MLADSKSLERSKVRKIWEHNFWYSVGRVYIDFCTRTSFSSITIEGKDKLPVDMPILLAPNHCAALIDPLLLLLVFKNEIGFGARSDIFKNKRVGSILRWLRILPMARERDGLKEVAKNFETFEEITDCLDHNVPFCIYSEGTHRAERGMMPVKKGIFKVAKNASKELNRPVFIVPVGVSYEDFFMQFKRVIIRIGEPFDINDYFINHSEELDSNIYKDLCEKLRNEDLTLLENFPERTRRPLIPSIATAILSAPLFIASIVCALPIWLPSVLILKRMKDKAWTHTVFYVFRLLLPLFWPFWWISCLLFNFYDSLLKDIKR